MRWYCSLLWLGLVILTLTGCYPQTSTGPGDAVVRPVTVRKITLEPAAETLTLIGSIEPWQEAVLYFEVTGIVDEVLVEEGDSVERGDDVARLVLDDYELARLQANAQLQAAWERWKLLETGTRKEDLEAARANYARASARAEYWTGEWSRKIILFEKKVISALELEQVEREHHAAREEKRWAKARLDKAIAGPRDEEIEAAAAEVTARTQAAALAKRQLDKATLRAPFDGYVEKRLLDAGAYINVFPTGGVPVVHLVDLQKVDAVIAVPEAFLSRFAPKQKIEIASAVDEEISAKGEITSVGKVADRASGTYQLRASIDNSDGRFTGGMVVTAKTTAEVPRDVIRIPLTALCRAYGQPPYVLLVKKKRDGNKVVKQEVELGPIAGDQVEISAGLTEGELLITGGRDRVVVGDRVSVRGASQTPATRSQRQVP